jgi:hypothetical protein
MTTARQLVAATTAEWVETPEVGSSLVEVGSEVSPPPSVGVGSPPPGAGASVVSGGLDPDRSRDGLSLDPPMRGMLGESLPPAAAGAMVGTSSNGGVGDSVWAAAGTAIASATSATKRRTFMLTQWRMAKSEICEGPMRCCRFRIVCGAADRVFGADVPTCWLLTRALFNA